MYKFFFESAFVLLSAALLPTIFPSLIPSFLTSNQDAILSNEPVPQNYTTITLSTDPLVVYINDFFSDSEIVNLLELSDPLFVPSRVFSEDADTGHKHRVSSTCLLPDNVPAVQLINKRVLALLQSLPLPHDGLEALQLVRYGSSEYFDAHYDWFDTLIREKGWHGRLYNRLASIFFYLDANCTGGETWFSEFPEGLAEKMGDDVVRKADGEKKGIVFKPRRGSGVMWVNLLESGYGNPDTIHAGLPLVEGSKVGMNVWIKRSFYG